MDYDADKNTLKILRQYGSIFIDKREYIQDVFIEQLSFVTRKSS